MICCFYSVIFTLISSPHITPVSSNPGSHTSTPDVSNPGAFNVSPNCTSHYMKLIKMFVHVFMGVGKSHLQYFVDPNAPAWLIRCISWISLNIMWSLYFNYLKPTNKYFKYKKYKYWILICFSLASFSNICKFIYIYKTVNLFVCLFVCVFIRSL